jgi:DNA-binding IclR family transcriptional regulator
MFDDAEVPGPIRNSYHVLFVVSGAGNAGISAKQAAHVSGLRLRTVYRHLDVLRRLGLVEPSEEQGRFRLGPLAESLAVRSVAQRMFLEEAQTVCDRLTSALGQPAHMTTFAHGTAVTIVTSSAVAAEAAAVVPTVLGSRRPAHASASGKIFLAHNDAALRGYLARPLEAFTERTITTPAQLQTECDRVRSRGWSSDDQEYLPGVCCLAVPVWGPSSSLVAAIAVSTRQAEITATQRNHLIPEMRSAAKSLTRKIGGRSR